MSSKSRRRATVAAGAILAGVAIPIAAAGTAWATNEDETVSQLEGQGLSSTDAKDVFKAEHSNTPVEVSYNGTIVVEANEGTTAAKEAFATSGATSDIAVAIGGNSIATDKTSSATTAFADGTNTEALSTGDNQVTVSATGTNSGAFSTDDSYTIVSATGTGASAAANNDGPYDNPYGGGQFTVIVANGTGASVGSADDKGVTDIAKGAHVFINSSGNSLSTATVTGAGGRASLFDTIGSSATVTKGEGIATVDYASNSSAVATGNGSYAWVDGYPSQQAIGFGINSSSAVDTNGTTTYVVNTGTEMQNTVLVDP